MRTLGTLAAILLLLLCTTTKSATINGRVIRPRRGSPGTIQEPPEILVAHSSAKINDLLSLTDSENVSKQNNARTSLDQQVDQSEIMLIRDLENMEDALSIMEYEPQKIHRKGKRKISAPHKNAEIEYNSETKEPTPTVISNTYYDPPPAPKKSAQVPKYYSNPSQENPSRSKPIDPEPVYPLPRSPKPRSKVRPLTPQIPEEAKLENLPHPLPSDLKSHKHDQVTSSPQFTKSIRKKKIRKRLREKINPENNDRPRGPKRSSVVTAQESSLKKLNANVSDRNQPKKEQLKVVDPVRGSQKLYENIKGPAVNNESPPQKFKDEPKVGAEETPSSLEAYGNVRDVQSRTPSFDGYAYKDSTYDKGSSFENEPTTLSSARGSKTSTTPSLDRDVYQSGTPSFGYGAYKDSTYEKGSSFENEPTTLSSARGSKTSTTPSLDRDVYQNSRTSFGYGPPHKGSSYEEGLEKEATTSSSTGLRGNANFAYGNDKSYRKVYVNDEPVTLDYDPVTPSSVEIYDTSVTSNQKPERTSSKTRPYEDVYESTPSPTLQTVRPTVGPTSYYAPSTSGRLDTWTPATKLKRLKDAEEVDRSDVVAEATNLGDKEESKNRRVYEDTSEEDYPRNERMNGNGERYAEKYEDAQAEGTEDEKHEGGKGGGGKGGKGEFEEGEGAKHEEGHHETDDEKGEKGYESWHKEEKANKGHHDKEQHSNHYEEEDAKKKDHKEDGEYHEEHQKGEHGEKDAAFDEKGEHKKGHNTKGEHFVHKKDEFEKRTEFFDEYHEDDDSEKDGEFHHEHESSKGGHEKKGHLDKGEHEEQYGKKGHHEKGEHYHKEDGHKQAEGKDDHYEHEDMHGQKKEQDEEKKWAYKKGDDGGDGGKDHKSDR